jgi:hypothetical protein
MKAILFLLLPLVYSLSVCKDIDNNDVPNCNLKVHACQNFKLLSADTYDISFMDKSVGIWGPRFVNKDKTYAGKQALVGLFNQNYGCNCFTSPDIPSTITLGHCLVTGKICYYFQSVSDLDNKVPSYKLVITDTYHGARVTSNIASLTDISSLINAFTDVYAKFQSLPTTAACLQPIEQNQCSMCLELKQTCETTCNATCLGIEYTCGTDILTPLGCSQEAMRDTPYEWPSQCGPMP